MEDGFKVQDGDGDYMEKKYHEVFISLLLLLNKKYYFFEISLHICFCAI